MATIVFCAAVLLISLSLEALEKWKRSQKRCPHGIQVNAGGACLECENETRRLEEQQELAAKRQQAAKELREAAKELRANEIKRLSEAWLSNASAYLEMSPRQFEDAVAELFRRLDYEVEQTPFTRDGGKDAILRKSGKKYLLECKRYAAAQVVGRRDLQILFAAMHTEGAVGGFCVTTGRFANPAKEYAAGVNITLYDPANLPFLANKAYPVSADFSRASVLCRECGAVTMVPVEILPGTAQCPNGHPVISNIVTADLRILREGEVPYCGTCGAPMRLVEWRGRKFWGCTSYPKCRSSKPLRPRI
jgi:HJR/Mrr/RecB family endonuclease